LVFSRLDRRNSIIAVMQAVENVVMAYILVEFCVLLIVRHD
jgi:hypothetical protein